MRERRDERGNFHPDPVKKQSTPPRCQVCLLCQINPLFRACSWGAIKYSFSYSKNAEVSSSVTIVALLLFPSALRRSVPSDTPHCSKVLQRTFRWQSRRKMWMIEHGFQAWNSGFILRQTKKRSSLSHPGVQKHIGSSDTKMRNFCPSQYAKCKVDPEIRKFHKHQNIQIERQSISKSECRK